MARRTAYCGMIALVLCLPAFASSLLTFEAVALGGLGGSWSTAQGLNSSGVAAGTAALPSGQSAPFISSGAGAATTPGSAPGAFGGRARGINDAGQTVGTSYLPSGAHATVWYNGQATLLSGFGGPSYGNAINNSGAVAGNATNASGAGTAVLFDGAWTDIGSDLNMGWSAAFAINDAHQVAGYGEIAPGVFRGFTWQAGTATQLGTLGGSSSYAFGINGSGAVAGHAQTASGATHAFLYDGSMLDLGTLGGSSSYAYDVNAAGWVVGHSWLADGSQTHAFLFTGDGLLDLNLLLRNAGEWELLEAYGINDAGQIVGAGLHNGERMAFRLEMISTDTAIVHNPEPGTIGLMACGLGLIAFGLWRRDRRS